MRSLLVAAPALACLAALGCAPPRPAAEAIPEIRVSPGVAARIALLDRYSLHDGMRRQMTKRPHVWVEEVAEEEDDEDASADDAAAKEGDEAGAER